MTKKMSKEYYRDHGYRSRYGITLDDYNAMYAKQDGKCAICRTSLPKLNVDHCHATGKVRGLLCTSCNTGIGLFKDNSESCARAAEYLRT